MYQRFCMFVSTGTIVSLLLLFALYQSPWRGVRKPQLSDWMTALHHNASESPSFVQDAKVNETTEPVAPEIPADYNNTDYNMTLVLATMSYTDNSWVSEQLSDLLGPYGNLYTAFYVVDNENAPLHTPENKGHEAMAYLSYMIDFYDTLPEISIFMHGHAEAWHNNYLLDMSSSQIVRQLNPEKVMQDGYFNLRCHWSPGCPEHLNPLATEYDDSKREEMMVKDAWAVLFPLDSLPPNLAQPCCSQFAVTRSRIHELPREKYVQFRNWLLDSGMNDYITGRIFEYFWQYIFNSTPVFCPDPRICYCEGYGMCFEDPDEYRRFFDVVSELDRYRKELRSWEEWTSGKNIERRVGGLDDESEDGRSDFDRLYEAEDAVWAEISKRQEGAVDASGGVHIEGPDAATEGQATREEWLREKIGSISEDLWNRKQAALESGRDPARKAAAIEAARILDMNDLKDGPPY